MKVKISEVIEKWPSKIYERRVKWLRKKHPKVLIRITVLRREIECR